MCVCVCMYIFRYKYESGANDVSNPFMRRAEGFSTRMRPSKLCYIIYIYIYVHILIYIRVRY